MINWKFGDLGFLEFLEFLDFWGGIVGLGDL